MRVRTLPDAWRFFAFVFTVFNEGLPTQRHVSQRVLKTYEGRVSSGHTSRVVVLNLRAVRRTCVRVRVQRPKQAGTDQPRRLKFARDKPHGNIAEVRHQPEASKAHE